MEVMLTMRPNLRAMRFTARLQNAGSRTSPRPAPSRAPAVVDEVMARQPATYALGDQALAAAPPHYWRLPEVLDALMPAS